MMMFKESTLMSIRMLGMVDYIKDNRIKKQDKKMELVSNYGQMVQNMKVFGKMIKRMEKEE